LKHSWFIFSKVWFFLALFGLGIALSVNAQSLTQETYAILVKENSEQHCPYELDGVLVNKIYFDSGYLHFDMTMKDIYMFGRDTAELKTYFANLIRYRYEFSRHHDLFEKLVDIHGGLIYDMTLDSSRRSFSLQYTPEEYQQIWDDRKKPEYQDSTKWLARHDVFIELYLEKIYTFVPRSPGDESLLIDSVLVKDDTVKYYISGGDPYYKACSEHREDYRRIWDNILLFNYDEPPFLSKLYWAGYDLHIIYENLSHTDSFQLCYSNAQLYEMLSKVYRFVLANDEQLEIYLQHFAKSLDWIQNQQNSSDFYKIQDAEYRDQTLHYTYQIYENQMEFNKSPEELQVFKRFLCSMTRNSLESNFEHPDIIFDTVLITFEDLMHHIKGFDVLFIEENTRKALRLFISSDEILNAKLPEGSSNQQARDMIIEQTLGERFALELVKKNREECPIVSGNVIIDSLKYDFENLHIYCRIQSKASLNSNKLDDIKNTLQKQLVFSAQSESFLFDNLLRLRGGLMLHYKMPKLDSTILIYFSPSEMVEIKKDNTLSERDQARAALNSFAESVNTQLPQLLDFNTRFDYIRIEDEHLVYHYTILDQFETFQQNATSMKWSIRSTLSSDDVQTQYIIQLCIHSGYGMCFQYAPFKKGKKKNKKGKMLEICISHNELQTFVQE